MSDHDQTSPDEQSTDQTDPAAVSDPQPGQQPAEPTDHQAAAQAAERADEQGALRAQAVAALTAACRLRGIRTHCDGTTGPGGPVDFADFLAGVLACVAANVGSTDRLTAGRPGSWEADLVHQLVAGTVGHDDQWLFEHRTEPVTVPLNVPDLAWQIPGFPDWDHAMDTALQPYTVDPDAAALAEADWEAIEDAQTAEEQAVITAYTDLYTRYATAFTAAVQAAAARIPGLTESGAPVTVVAVTDPFNTPTAQALTVVNPDEFDPTADDDLAVRLWRAAAAAVPVPTAPTITTPDTSSSNTSSSTGSSSTGGGVEEARAADQTAGTADRAGTPAPAADAPGVGPGGPVRAVSLDRTWWDEHTPPVSDSSHSTGSSSDGDGDGDGDGQSVDGWGAAGVDAAGGDGVDQDDGGGWPR